MSFFSWVQSVLVGGNGNVANVTAGNALQVDSSGSGAGFSKIEGDISGNIAEVNNNNALRSQIYGPSGDTAEVTTSGELKVVNPPPVPPSTTTPVKISAKNNMSGTQDDLYTITSGTTLIIQRMSAGSESSNSGHIIELFEDPNGDLSVLNIIDDIYVNGSSNQKDLLGSLAGDGVRRILLRRRSFGGGSNEVTAIWQGYEQ